jgi:hypothetical protein
MLMKIKHRLNFFEKKKKNKLGTENLGMRKYPWLLILRSQRWPKLFGDREGYLIFREQSASCS